MTNIIDLTKRLKYSAMSDKGLLDMQFFHTWNVTICEEELKVSNISAKDVSYFKTSLKESEIELKDILKEIKRRIKRNPNSILTQYG